ncbi:MAG: hypothetical protein NVS9B9_24260 [Ktedonobacteraceae bacterium]
MTLERLQTEGTVPFAIANEDHIPFAHGVFCTPSGKVEIYSAQAAAKGYDPVPGWVPEVEVSQPAKARHISGEPFDAQSPDKALPLLCPAAHHFVSSTFANLDTMKTKEHAPTLRIHPHDAEIRNIRSGQRVRISNARGSCQLVACVTEDVRPGVLATTTVWWSQFSPDQRNVNWTTSDRLADFAGGSTFYTNLVNVVAI